MEKEIILDQPTDNLIISQDTTGENNEIPIAVLLFTPDMNKWINHHHIELNPEAAQKMHAWLGRFLDRIKK